MANPDKRQGPATTSLRPFVAVGAGLLATCLLIDLAIGHGGFFGLDGLPGFYAVFGLSAGFAIIGIAKAIGALLKRPDSYYPD